MDEAIMIHLMKEMYHCCYDQARRAVIIAKRAGNVDQIEKSIHEYVRRCENGHQS